MGYARCFIAALLQTNTTERPEKLHRVKFAYLQYIHIYAKKRGIAKKLIITIRAIMVRYQVDYFAGDFNGTVWRCHNRGDRSTIDEAFDDCAVPTPPGPTPLWRLGFIPNMWADVCLTQTNIGRYENTARSPFQWKFLACARMIKPTIMRYGYTLILLIGTIKKNVRSTYST